MTIHGIHPSALPLTPAELVPVFIELSTARRNRPVEIELRDAPSEIEQHEEALYQLVLQRLRLAASVAEIKVTKALR